MVTISIYPWWQNTNLLSHLDQPLISSSIKIILYFIYLIYYGAVLSHVYSPYVCLDYVVISLNNIFTDKLRWGDIHSALCQASPVQDLHCWDITHALKVEMEINQHVGCMQGSHFILGFAEFWTEQRQHGLVANCWGFYTKFCFIMPVPK